MTPNVHVLHGGSPLCRFSLELPRNWPEGHLWVRLERDHPDGQRDATCLRCIELAKAASSEAAKRRAPPRVSVEKPSRGRA